MGVSRATLLFDLVDFQNYDATIARNLRAKRKRRQRQRRRRTEANTQGEDEHHHDKDEDEEQRRQRRRQRSKRDEAKKITKHKATDEDNETHQAQDEASNKTVVGFPFASKVSK